MRKLAVAALLAVSSAVALGQSAPIKMGLWEKEMVITGGATPDATLKAKSCVTPAEWQNMVENAQKPREGCTTNKTKTSNGYTFDTSCTMHDGSALVASGTSTIKNSEHIIAEVHTSMTIKGQKRETTMRSTSHFVSADCGSVKPGEPEEEEN
jgi:hypothetical protein